MNEYMYFLTLVDRLKEGPWKEEDEKKVGEHFKYLQSLEQDEKLVFAGRTQVEDSKTIGLVLFYAKDESEASLIMSNDPAVKGGIMTAELAPFATAIKGSWK